MPLTKAQQKKADALLALIEGGMSAREASKQDDTPGLRTFFRWLDDESNAKLRQRYARACEARADAIFEEILEISDDGSNDWMAINAEDDEGYRLNGEHVQRSRLRVDARKWMLGKMQPKKYGDKLQHEGPGKDGAFTFEAFLSEVASSAGRVGKKESD